MVISTGGIDYYCTVHNRARHLPFLLLLHGFMGSGRSFEHLVDPLSRFVNPVTIDLLGHGKSAGTPDPERYRTDMQVHDLYNLISRLDLNPLCLHGYSMGGRLALQYALRQPVTLSGLILESTHGGSDDKQSRLERNRKDDLRAKAIEHDYESFLNEWQKLPLFDNGIPVERKLKQRYERIQRRQQPEFISASLQGFGAGRMPSVNNELGRLELPVLLLAGEKDEKYVTKMSKMHERLPNGWFQVVERAGHRIHLENPETYVSKLKSFITSAIISP